MRGSGIVYRMSFLLGGALFAVVSYMVGTAMYQVELDAGEGLPIYIEAVGAALGNALSLHPFTFTTWVLGTSGLFAFLGYLFNREKELRRVVEAMAVTDSLTLLHNRRYLMQQLSLEVERFERHITPALSVLMIDIDDFKHHNDTYGHLAGDNELRMVAMSIREVARKTDIVGRYGGEEMVVVSIGASKEGALELAERIREEVKRNCSVTVSIGVSSYPDDGEDIDALINSADEAMYEAKRQGKDRVRAALPVVT
jgi:diguanylate cyclase (GGDEF)-like protein